MIMSKLFCLSITEHIQSRQFFDSPIEEKEKCAIQVDNAGWSGMHTETLDAKTQRIGDFKE